MPLEELAREISRGVRFSGIEADGFLVGIKGVQPVRDVTLIRHAYMATAHRAKGLGGVLLSHLLQETKGSIPVGTWAAATDSRLQSAHRRGWQSAISSVLSSPLIELVRQDR